MYLLTAVYCFRETDRDILGAAASIFIVSSVKIPTEATTLITSELNHQLPDQRIAAVYRFQALWRNRHQVSSSIFFMGCPRLLRRLKVYVKVSQNDWSQTVIGVATTRGERAARDEGDAVADRIHASKSQTGTRGQSGD